MDSDNILSILAALGGGQTDPQGIVPVTYQPPPPMNNVLQAASAIGAAPHTPPLVPPKQSEPPAAPKAEHPRKRLSVFDIIGRIADTVATVGGSQPMYQPTLDAQRERINQVDMDELRKRLTVAQVGTAEQAPQDAMRDRIAQALGAVAQNPNAISMWPQIAQEAGIDPQKAEAIGQIIQANPDAAGIFARSLGYEPSKQGSPTSALQNYSAYQEILATQGPEAAEQFMRFAQPEMTAIKPYQEAQLTQAEREFQRQLAKDDRDANIAEREIALKEGKGTGAGADLTPTQRGVVNQKLKLLPVIRQQVNRVRNLQREMSQGGTLARGMLGGLVPGAVAGGTAERFDKALGALRKSILALTRVPGVGSMSNYETALDEMALPSRWGSDEGRAEAISGIEELVNGLETGYKELVPTARATTPSRGNSAARTNLSAPKIGTVRQGYRFKGGNPASPSSWEKVN